MTLSKDRTQGYPLMSFKSLAISRLEHDVRRTFRRQQRISFEFLNYLWFCICANHNADMIRIFEATAFIGVFSTASVDLCACSPLLLSLPVLCFHLFFACSLAPFRPPPPLCDPRDHTKSMSNFFRRKLLVVMNDDNLIPIQIHH